MIARYTSTDSGKNPHIKREYTDAQRQAMRENLSANLRKKTEKTGG